MFKVARVGANRLEIEISGKLDADGMREAIDTLREQSSGIENGTMLYDVVDYHLPSLAAIAIEFSQLPSLLGLMQQFRRAAVLSDKQWLQKISELEGKLFKDLEIKAFTREQRAQAIEWLQQAP